MYRLALAGLLMVGLLPEVRGADDPPAPERLFGVNTLVFLQYDGIDAHQAAFAKTATGELWKEDLGTFVDYVVNLTRESIGPTLLKDEVLRGGNAQRLKVVRSGFNAAPDVIRRLGKRGFLFGVEMTGFFPPKAQGVFVIPNVTGDKDRQEVAAALNLLAALGEIDVKQVEVKGRKIQRWNAELTDPVQVSWWQEGPHVVFVVGNDEPATLIDRMDRKQLTLADMPIYKALKKFDRYETALRGFADMEKVIVPLSLVPYAPKILDRLGLRHLKSLTLHFGFEDKNLRSTVELQLPGERRGLFKLAGATPLDVDKLPPLPPDAGSVYALDLDLAAVYELIVQTVDEIAGTTDVKDYFAELKSSLGIDVRKDLLDSLGSKIVLYNSPSEGILTFNLGLAIQVKDADKLQSSLNALLESLPTLAQVEIRHDKQVYRGVNVYTARVPQEGFIFVPSYTIHEGWLVLGFYPQIPQGYVLRAAGKGEKWKPTQLLGQVLARTKKDLPAARVVSVSVSDPRPSIRQLATIGPFISGIAESFAPGSFDTSAIPNAAALTEPLYPNVSILSDDGTTIRYESYDSFSLPFVSLSGTDFYLVALAISLLG